MQEFILRWTLEPLAHTLHDNRQDGSLYTSITSLENKKQATFCAVADHSNRDRARVHIMHLEDEVSGEASLCNTRTIPGNTGRCLVVRIILGYEYGEYCKDKKAMNLVTSGAFTVDRGFSVVSLVVKAM